MRVCSVPESSRTKKTTLWLLPRTLHEHLWFFFFALLCAYAQSQHQRSCKVQRITTNVPQQRTLGIRRPAYHQQRPTCRWLSPPHLLTRDLLPFACAFICATLWLTEAIPPNERVCRSLLCMLLSSASLWITQLLLWITNNTHDLWRLCHTYVQKKTSTSGTLTPKNSSDSASLWKVCRTKVQLEIWNSKNWLSYTASTWRGFMPGPAIL